MRRVRRQAKKTERRSAAQRALTHAMWSPAVSRCFEVLQVGLSLVERGPPLSFYPIHQQALNVGHFEHGADREARRTAYNQESLSSVYRSKKTLLGEHAGFTDAWVPLVVDGEVAGAFVCGPFSREQPTARGIEQRYRALFGEAEPCHGPLFEHYTDAVLKTPVFDAAALDALVGLLGCLADLATHRGDPRRTMARAIELLHQAWAPALDERMHAAVSGMIDERLSASWSGSFRLFDLKDLNLDEMPGDVAVVLAVAPRTESRKPLDERLERLDWQRTCVRLAAEPQGVLCGRLGDEGVVFLRLGAGGWPRRRQALIRLSQSAIDLAARKYRLSAHAGIGPEGGPRSLPERFKVGRAAAEQALFQGIRFVDGTEQPREVLTLVELSELSHAVVMAFRTRPAQLGPRLDRFIDAIGYRSAFRESTARAHLDGLLAEVIRSLLSAKQIDRRSVASVLAELERRTGQLPDFRDLVAHYRGAFMALADALGQPTVADQNLKLERGLAFMADRFNRPLRLAAAARVAGLAPAYFSRLLKQRHGTTFEQYLSNLRLSHAKALLEDTALSVERIAEQSGFSSAIYFYQAFRKALGTTPAQFRKDAARRRTSRAERDTLQETLGHLRDSVPP